MQRKALITGITGQDGAYLARFLLEKGYTVYGSFRRSSTPNFWRLNFLGITNQVELIPADLLDQSSLTEAIIRIRPQEVYNLAAQSYVGASFEQPVVTGEITGLGLTRLLDSIRLHLPRCKFYQASTSELYGGCGISPQDENTPFVPRSPYAAAKLYAHWVTINYRMAYNLFAVCGILFNHESPLRGVEFVTRKITYNLAKIRHGLASSITLGNLEARRDWGYASDFVECMWKMLQLDRPEDFVIATGENHSVKEFASIACRMAGLSYTDYVKTDASLYRPTEVDTLLGNPAKAKRMLNWNPTVTSFEELIRIMVQADMEMVSRSNQMYSFKSDTIKEFPHFKE